MIPQVCSLEISLTELMASFRGNSDDGELAT